MKTAISIPDTVFKEAEKAAKEFQCSRSQFFTLAARDFLKKVKSRKLFQELNEAYGEQETDEEISLRQKSRKYYARKVLRDDY